MTFQSINLGSAPNDGTGDDLRTAGGKINANFDTLFSRIDLATTEVAGLMSPKDKAKLDAALTEVALATRESAGLMSPEDKVRLDNALTEVGLATKDVAGLMSPTDKARLDAALTDISGEELATKPVPVVGDEVVVFDSEDDLTPKLVPAGAFAMALLTRTARTGVAYTLTAEDAGRGVTMAEDGANTVTIPAGDTLPVGAVVNVIQIGAGPTTVAAAEGVTVNGIPAGTLHIAARWQGVSLWKIGADEWIASGAFE